MTKLISLFFFSCYLCITTAPLAENNSPNQNNSISTSTDQTKGEKEEAAYLGPIYPKWKEITSGLEYTKLQLPPSTSFVRSDLYLLRINLNDTTITGVHAPTHLGKKSTSVKAMVQKKNGLAGINANFFDTKNDSLGVFIVDTETLSSLHSGGKLLSGIFQIKQGIPSIISRSQFTPEMVTFAIQAGPRLIIDKRKTEVLSQDQRSRRSGIALTQNGEVLLYATQLRFPGATLEEIQDALINSDLGVTHALNLDGGGSSQLFFYKDLDHKKETSITGGDEVTSAIVVLPKETN